MLSKKSLSFSSSSLVPSPLTFLIPVPSFLFFSLLLSLYWSFYISASFRLS